MINKWYAGEKYLLDPRYSYFQKRVYYDQKKKDYRFKWSEAEEDRCCLEQEYEAFLEDENKKRKADDIKDPEPPAKKRKTDDLEPIKDEDFGCNKFFELDEDVDITDWIKDLFTEPDDLEPKDDESDRDPHDKEERKMDAIVAEAVDALVGLKEREEDYITL